MARMIALKGNLTTTGGRVLYGDDSMLDDGTPIARHLGLASCPRCGKSGQMLGTAANWGVRHVARLSDGDIAACDCPRQRCGEQRLPLRLDPSIEGAQLTLAGRVCPESVMPSKTIKGIPVTAAMCSCDCARRRSGLPSGADTLAKPSMSRSIIIGCRLSRAWLNNTARRRICSAPSSFSTAARLVLRTIVLNECSRSDTLCSGRANVSSRLAWICRFITNQVCG
jgi:uncharacterized Zn-binding protein involved in type VI secretion